MQYCTVIYYFIFMRILIIIDCKDYPRAWLKRDSANLSELLRARTTEPVLKKYDPIAIYFRSTQLLT